MRDASPGVAHARKRSSREVPTDVGWVTRPARFALGLFVVYAMAMLISGRIGRAAVDRAAAGERAARTMVGPVPVNPFRRDVLREVGERYERGRLAFGPTPLYTPDGIIDRGRDAPGVAAASVSPDGVKFLTWARFPFFHVDPVGDSLRVRMSDAR